MPRRSIRSLTAGERTGRSFTCIRRPLPRPRTRSQTRGRRSWSRRKRPERRRAVRLGLFILLGAAAAGSCKPIEKRTARDSTAVATETIPRPLAAPPAPAAPVATKVTVVQGFLTPESVLHDSAQDIYLVSNINGSPTAKDNNGFISRVKPDGAVENLKFIEGGRSGVTLNAPKGLALLGDTLWVTDIDRIRAFNARTGTPLDSVRLDSAGAVFLNDIAIATTGAIYITDTGIRFDDVGNVLHPGPDRVFRVGPDRKVTVA